MRPTDILLKQITELFSPDEAMPPYKQHACHKQLGSTDCGAFAIAYVVDVLLGNEPEKIRYDQSKMREHLVNCFESGKLTPFPKYRTEDKIVSPTSDNKTGNPEKSWSTPKRYNFRPRNRQKQLEGNISLTNRYSPLMNE